MSMALAESSDSRLPITKKHEDPGQARGIRFSIVDDFVAMKRNDHLGKPGAFVDFFSKLSEKPRIL